jgi:hypothetical protein
VQGLRFGFVAGEELFEEFAHFECLLERRALLNVSCTRCAR